MALIGNRSVLHKSPGRFLSGTVASGDRSNFGKHGQCRNAYQVYDKKQSSPIGYRPHYCWIMAQRDGGMASIGRVSGSGAVATPGNLAGGLNAEALLSGSGGIDSAAMGLIMSAVASLSGTGGFTADMVGNLAASASLAGSSTLSAPLGAIAGALATLAGQGGVCCSDLRADGYMSADIAPATTVAADVIGRAVWAASASESQVTGSMGEAVLAGAGGIVPPSETEIADAVWTHAQAQDLQTKLLEAWGRLGLDPSAPLVTGQTQITFGQIVMAMTGSDTITVTRQ